VAVGLLGGGIYDERFEAKQIVVMPDGADGVRITEIVDDDFGTVQRHGYERLIPNDFGEPEDVEASSPDAQDDLSVSWEGSHTRIRIGDPDVTYIGQHRYVLSYTLPDARISTGELALDISDENTSFETGRIEIIVTGFELTDPVCQLGLGATGGCELVRDGDVYRAVIEPLAPHTALTIRGTITALTEPTQVAEPPVPPRRDDNSKQWALGLGVLGAIAAGGAFAAARRFGRNEVAGANVADAAFADGSTRLVSDAQLDDMATTEFEAPRGLRPWQGAMLLNERVDNDSVSAWFSDLIAQEVLTVTGDSTQVLSPGPKVGAASPAIQKDVASLFEVTDKLMLARYQPKLGKLWNRVYKDQIAAATQSGWWKKFPPGTRPRFPKPLGLIVSVGIAILAICVWQQWLRAWPAAIIASLVIPAYVVGSAYRPLLPVRSAEGSALALRAESFRRFLAASEGPHVDWAWKHGLLREYSAWAVALGAADAWGRAIAGSSVPPQEAAMHSTPLYVYSRSGDWASARSKPGSASSSSSGGSSFSGGGGGGGGGGSSGNW
jgi:uncharacterized membrane protein YgcG